MRSYMAAVVVAGLAAAASLGAINVQLLANAQITSTGNLVPGTGTNQILLTLDQTATVYGFFDNPTSGIQSIGGKVTATTLNGSGNILTASNFKFLDTFSGIQPQIDEETGLPIPGTAIPPAAFTYDGGGSVGNIGSGQGSLIANPSYARNTPKALFSCTITLCNVGQVRLDWRNVLPLVNSGWMTTGCTAGDTAMGTMAGLIVTVPEPATMALLALGGLLVTRRRRG